MAHDHMSNWKDIKKVIKNLNFLLVNYKIAPKSWIELIIYPFLANP